LGKMTGKQLKNEDTAVIFLDILPGMDFYGIFDGHGGKAASNYVKLNVSRIFLEVMERNSNDLGQCFREVYIETNRQMKKHFEGIDAANHSTQQKRLADVGTTSVMCVLSRTTKQLFLANAGDSRAILGKKGTKHNVIRLSIDHKPSSTTEVKRIRKNGGYIMTDDKSYRAARPAASMLALAVVRGLGDFSSQPIISHEPHVVVVQLIEDEDEVLIMGSDGLWDLVSDKEAVKISKSVHHHPFRAAIKLRDYAYLQRSGDDITVIVVSLRQSLKEGS